MAAYNIYIDGGFITTTDVPVTLNHFSNARADTTFEFDEPTDTFQFFWNTYEPQQSRKRRILSGPETYLYSDLTAVIETIGGVPTVIPIANARALESYLKNKIVFFFNPTFTDPVGVLTKEFLIEVKKGNVPGHRLVHVHGFSDSINTTHHHVWNTPVVGDLVWQTVAAEYDVYSDNVNDNGVGALTGAHTIVLECLLADFTTQFETVTLNGITPATTVNGPYIRVQSSDIDDVGTFGGKNLGNIRTEVTSAGAKTGDLQSYVEIGESTSQNTQYTIPADETGFIQYTSFTIDSNKTTKIELHARERADIVLAPFKSDKVIHQWDGLVSPHQEPFIAGHTFEGKTDIWMDAEVDTGSGSILEADYSILIIENAYLP